MLTRSGLKLLDFGIAKRREIPKPDSTPSIDATDHGARDHRGHADRHCPLHGARTARGETRRCADGHFRVRLPCSSKWRRGGAAFTGGSTAALVAAILSDSRPVVAKTDPGLPRGLDRIISACLARDPDDRCQHAADLLRELRWANEELTDPAGPTNAPTASRRWRVHVAWASALARRRRHRDLGFSAGRSRESSSPQRHPGDRVDGFAAARPRVTIRARLPKEARTRTT